MNIQDEIKELKAKLEELEKQVEKKEKYKDIKSRFIPEYSDDYYYISAYGVILADTCKDMNADDYRISIGNCFRTEEEAKKHKRILINTQKLKDLAERLNNGEEIDWNNGCIKHSICLTEDGLDYALNTGIQTQGVIYCLDENFLCKAIEEIGEEELIELIKGE